jgi:D-alanyl-D-alanine dipeptidase
MKVLTTLFILLSLIFTAGKTPQSSVQNGRVNDTIPAGFTEVNFDSLAMLNKMAYADTANFMHQKLYPCARCFLRPAVAAALENANELAQDKGYTIVIYDCYRPYSLQHKMYKIVNNPEYVAKPTKGSNHNRGAAVDLSLADKKGNLLDMGGAFDEFSEVSHYSYQNISKEAKANRKLLRGIMVKAGFSAYESEWWHFDYKKLRYATSGTVWGCKP